MEDNGESKNAGTMKDVAEILDTEDKLKGGANKHGLAPDIICCPITLEPMTEPTITPDGISYDLVSLKGLVQRGVYIDPTTRNQFKPEQLVINENLTAFIRGWLDEYPECEFSNNYEKIMF